MNTSQKNNLRLSKVTLTSLNGGRRTSDAMTTRLLPPDACMRKEKPKPQDLDAKNASYTWFGDIHIHF